MPSGIKSIINNGKKEVSIMSVIRDIIKDIDQTDETQKEIKETLSILVELAQEKAKTASQKIELELQAGKVSDNLTVPITKIIKSRSEYRAKTATSTDIVDKIAESLADMFSGDEKILNGIAQMVNIALTAIMGAGEGEESETSFYNVVAEYPAIVRYDFYFWGRNTIAKSVRTKMETAFACVGYKSAVDVSKLDFNTFLALYGPVLTQAFGNDETKLREMIQQSKGIFEMFSNSSVANINPDRIAHNLAMSKKEVFVPSLKIIQNNL